MLFRTLRYAHIDRLAVHALVTLTALMAITEEAVGQGAHEHGTARLDVTADGENLMLRFESPLDNLVGFESAPKTERQRSAIRKMAEKFRRPQDVFVPTEAAGCTPVSVELASAAIPAALLSTTPAAPGPASKSDGHADLDVDIAFRCTRPDALKGIKVRLFEAFPNLRRIDAGVVTAKGQTGARLSPQRAVLNW